MKLARIGSEYLVPAVARETADVTARARIPRGGEAHVGHLATVVAIERDVRHVPVGLVRAGDPERDEGRRPVDDDAPTEADGADEADLRPGGPLDVALAGEKHFVDAEYPRDTRLVHVVVAADDDHDDFGSGEVNERLEH
jgi:hypothetical protein